MSVVESIRQSRLYSHYFGEEAEGGEVEQERAKQARDVWAELVSRGGWSAFKRDIMTMRVDVAPGNHENMLYACGLRDGVQLVIDKMELIESTITEEDADVGS